jgi:rhodanese-related sulfurtransferase
MRESLSDEYLEGAEERAMKRSHGWMAVLAVLSLLALSAPAGAQAPAGQTEDPKAFRDLGIRIPRLPMPSVKPKALPAWLAANPNALILDLRTEEAFRRLHLPEAINLPLDALPARYAELPRDRLFLLVDEDGTDTLLAGSYLKRKGFRDTVRLYGGMEAWRQYEERKRK